MGQVSFWALFSKTHLVTLFKNEHVRNYKLKFAEIRFCPVNFGRNGFAKSAPAAVCGGARTTYDSCIRSNTAQYCQRNAQCVTSAGGSLWCTGPKTGACYTYDRYLKKSWVWSAKGLKTARAYAASVVLPDGRCVCKICIPIIFLVLNFLPITLFFCLVFPCSKF
jgi:hypothetical protein